MKKFGFTTQNLQRFSGVYRCCCNLFIVEILDVLFRNVSLSRGQSTTRFGVSPFFRPKSGNFSLDVKQKHTFYRRKSTKIDKVSPSYKNILLELLTIQQQQHSVAIWDQVATLVRIPSYSSETVGGKESRCGPRNHGVSFVCSRR